MTGKELLEKLQAMQPEQLERHVLLQGEDRFRNSRYCLAINLVLRKINDKGKIDDWADEYICLDME